MAIAQNTSDMENAKFVTAGGQTAVRVANPDGSNITTGVQATPVDHSGTITTGGTAQQLMAANTNRRGFLVQNISTGDLWINELGTATAAQPSIKIAAGTTYQAPTTGVPTSAISIIGATTAQAFAAREW